MYARTGQCKGAPRRVSSSFTVIVGVNDDVSANGKDLHGRHNNVGLSAITQDVKYIALKEGGVHNSSANMEEVYDFVSTAGD